MFNIEGNNITSVISGLSEDERVGFSSSSEIFYRHDNTVYAKRDLSSQTIGSFD